ncbi:MAG: carboxypeptidase family protein [Planctomycetes bacterium]|nr:carboxypeptidase family protein [Planctomycetota bacterium]
MIARLTAGSACAAAVLLAAAGAAFLAARPRAPAAERAAPAAPAAAPAPAPARELAPEDFVFDGPIGSQGARIEKTGPNQFLLTLGHAPNQPTWCNKVGFQIKRHAAGNSLRLQVAFEGGKQYYFNDYFQSWSYDGKDWKTIRWNKASKDAKVEDTLVFPTFAQDTVYVGQQVPLSYEDVAAMAAEWKKTPYVKVHAVGQSLGKRDLLRIEVADPASPHPPRSRWVHYVSNQHPGEHNSRWRMVGMIQWLLGEQGADCRRRTICHFVPFVSPDGPSNGWYRVGAQGVDMNRSYRAEGSDPAQAHEAYLLQKDLEALMKSEAPVTTVWAMHTWGGIVEPICQPGPEMDAKVGPWTDLRDAIVRNDRAASPLIKPLKLATGGGSNTWSGGPHKQFGVTAFLCEGGGSIYTKEENLRSGAILMKGLAEYYKGTKEDKRE